ncbi:MAG: GNAT family N-acetyltransferase, partial [Gammaproteobacteria bacterium]
AEIAALARSWDELQRAATYRHVLQDHRWFCTWLEVFGRYKQPCVLLLREQGELIGIAPLVITQGYEMFPARKFQVHTADDYRYTRVPRWARPWPIRRLGFALSGALANRRSHFLLRAEDPRCYAAILDYAAGIASEWDLMVLEGVARDSTAERLLCEALAHSALSDDGRRFCRETVYATLPDTMEAWLATKTRHFRRRLVEQCRQVERRFPDLTVHEYRGPHIDAGMEALLELEKRSWKAEQTRDRTFYIGPEPDLQTFHRAVARAYAASDEAMVLVMEVEERPVAAIQCLERDAMLATIVTFMDQDYTRRLNTAPMFRRLVERAIERGVREIDFCGKTVNAEKWSDGTRYSQRYFIYNGRAYSRCLRGTSIVANRAYRAVSAWRGQADTATGAFQ